MVLCGSTSQFIKTIDRDTLFSFKIDGSPFNLPFHLINHVMTARNTFTPDHFMVMNTTLCFMWGYSIGLNFKRQTSDHCMRTNYRGSWFPLFFLTNLLTWNLKCKFANQPSTFCQHGPTGSEVCVSLDVCSLMREKTIHWIESCCGLCGPSQNIRTDYRNHHWRFSFQN